MSRKRRCKTTWYWKFQKLSSKSFIIFPLHLKACLSSKSKSIRCNGPPETQQFLKTNGKAAKMLKHLKEWLTEIKPKEEGCQCPSYTIKFNLIIFMMKKWYCSAPIYNPCPNLQSLPRFVIFLPRSEIPEEIPEIPSWY